MATPAANCMRQEVFGKAQWLSPDCGHAWWRECCLPGSSARSISVHGPSYGQVGESSGSPGAPGPG